MFTQLKNFSSGESLCFDNKSRILLTFKEIITYLYILQLKKYHLQEKFVFRKFIMNLTDFWHTNNIFTCVLHMFRKISFGQITYDLSLYVALFNHIICFCIVFLIFFLGCWQLCNYFIYFLFSKLKENAQF